MLTRKQLTEKAESLETRLAASEAMVRTLAEILFGGPVYMSGADVYCGTLVPDEVYAEAWERASYLLPEQFENGNTEDARQLLFDRDETVFGIGCYLVEYCCCDENGTTLRKLWRAVKIDAALLASVVCEHVVI